MKRDLVYTTSGQCWRVANKIDQRFGRLLVTRLVGKDERTGCALWECQCDCGNAVILASSQLGPTSGTQSCGCLQKERQLEAVSLPEGEGALRSLFAEYRRDAKRRGYVFDLTREQFAERVTKRCYYCGSGPSNFHIRKAMNGGMFYNGIDRLNNDLGYTAENSVACCWECNHLKGTRSVDEFMEHILRIAKHLKGKAPL
jgi:hypothetical protein